MFETELNEARDREEYLQGLLQEADSWISEIGDMREELAKASATIDDLNQRLESSSKSDHGALQSDHGALQSDHDALKKERDAALAEVEILQKNLDRALAAEANMETLKAQLAEATERIAAGELRFEEAKANSERVVAELQQNHEKNMAGELDRAQDGYNKEKERLNLQLDKKEKEVVWLQQEVKNKQEMLETAVANHASDLINPERHICLVSL
jgi:chromosome segregation ATPase